MNILSRFTIRAFIGPFLITFAVVQFILLMQFVWKYVDDLVGKGLEWYLIVELLVYTSASLVPLSLPLAVLLSSIMTFGKMGENYELIALKSSGISFFRIMRPLLITMVVLAVGAFYFSNDIIPAANLKSGSLLWDITQKKPAFNLQPGTFYTGIEGFSIKVDNKSGENGEFLEGVMIYDHSENRGNTKVIRSEKGKMTVDEKDNLLIFELENGFSYEEMPVKNRKERNRHPFVRTAFEKQVIRFDMSNFSMERTDEGLFKSDFRMKNVGQLHRDIDSLSTRMDSLFSDIGTRLTRKYIAIIDTLNRDSLDQFQKLHKTPTELLSLYSKGDQRNILSLALTKTRSARSYVSSYRKEVSWKSEIIARHILEFHKKFTLSVAIIMLFLVGAPLGSIIRKGGMGMPVVVAVLIFLFYHIATSTSDKLGRDWSLDPNYAMWIPVAIFAPLGIYLTYKSTMDSRLFDIDAYLEPLRKIAAKKKKKDATATDHT